MSAVVAANPAGEADVVRAKLEELAGQLDLGCGSERAAGSRSYCRRTPSAPWRENYPYESKLGRKPYETASACSRSSYSSCNGPRRRPATGSSSSSREGTRPAKAARSGGSRRTSTRAASGSWRSRASRPRAGRQLPAPLPPAPAGPGEIALFDRSWYNRAGVEHVMGFSQPDECAGFLADVPAFESGLVGDGIKVIKLWFSVARAEP